MLAAMPVFAVAQTAAILPNARTQFIDANGAPLVGGTVGFYVPSTLTNKGTWKDSGKTISNTNPVVLDALGSALIWGSGSYREILKNSSGAVVWDGLTTSVGGAISSITAGTGLTGGTITTTGTLALDLTKTFLTTTNGLVPAPAAVTGRFLADDGSWHTASGTGTVTSIATGPNLTGGPITGSGTIGLGTNVPLKNVINTWTAGQSIQSAAAGSSTSVLTLSPTDSAPGKPTLGIATGSSNSLWNMYLYDGVSFAGTLNFDMTSVTLNGSPLLTAAGSGFATLSGTNVFTNYNTITAGTSTSNVPFLVLKPSDYGTGKPQLSFQKDATANSYTFGLWDGSTIGGSINLSAATVTVPSALAIGGSATILGSAVCTQATGCPGGGGSGIATVYNVVATYGGDPTGSTDNVTAFNSALAACSGTNGGIIWFQAGTYRFNSGITDNVAGCSIQGAGPSATTLKPTGISGNFLTVTNTGVTPTTVSDLQITSGGSWSSGYALDAEGSWQSTHDVYILSTPQAIHVTNAAETRFDRLLIYNETASPIVLCDNAVGTVYATRWHQVTVGWSGTNTTATPMELGAGCNSATLDTVGIVQGANCLQTDAGFTFLFATDLECDFGLNGVVVNGGEALHFTNSYFQGAASGYNINFGPSFVGGATVTGSRIFGGGSGGVLINSPNADVTIVGNNFGANGNAGIAVGPNVQNFTITGNRIGNIEGFGGQTYCVLVNSGTSNGYIISNNNCMGNSNGVVDGGSGVKKSVTGNVGP